MLGKLFEKLYVYRVKQELLAQKSDVSFVEYIVNIPSNRAILLDLYRNAYYGAGQIAPFMGGIAVLEETLGIDNVPLQIRKVCAALLAQRLLKAQSNRQFWVRHIMILGHAEETVCDWMSRHEDDISDDKAEKV